MSLKWLEPDWPAPNWVRAASTLRIGGASQGDYASLNLADHVGDDSANVAKNRQYLRQTLELPGEPAWLQQRHGNEVVAAEAVVPGVSGDASFAREPGIVCAILTADCLPVLLCDLDNRGIAAVHAGWRGLAEGILEAAVQAMDCHRLIAWLGPAIGPRAFEVGRDVYGPFHDSGAGLNEAFKPAGSGKWLMDIYAVARARLNMLGVSGVYGGGWCTYSHQRRFFSYRRDGNTGRMATLIWSR